MARRVIVSLMGPTAAGKTDIAIALAQSVPIDIISVDSAMIYRGMDIGTAKPNPSVLDRYPHALVDIRDPAESYSVAQFASDAMEAVAKAFARGRLPLLAGGTMMYFKALKSGIADIPPTPAHVRAELAGRAAAEGLASLHRELASVDPVAAERIHPNNPQRLLRALEVYVSSGRPISEWWARQSSRGIADMLGGDLVEIALLPDRALLRRRIEQRLTAMLSAGFVEEVEGFKRRGDLHAALPSMRCVGYRQVWEHLDGAYDREEMELRILKATRDLAKRQLTWLKSFENHRTFDPTDRNVVSQILQYLDPLAILPR